MPLQNRLANIPPLPPDVELVDDLGLLGPQDASATSYLTPAPGDRISPEKQQRLANIPPLPPDVELVDDLGLLTPQKPFTESPHPIIATAMRTLPMIPAIGGTILGGPLVGAAAGFGAGAVMEAATEWGIEDRPVNPSEMVLQGLVNAIPGIPGGRTAGGHVLRGVGEGIGIGATNLYGGALARGEQMPTFDQAADTLATGGLVGGTIRGILSPASVRAERVREQMRSIREETDRMLRDFEQPPPPDAPSEPPSGPPPGPPPRRVEPDQPPPAPPAPTGEGPEPPRVVPGTEGDRGVFWRHDPRTGRVEPTDNPDPGPHDIIWRVDEEGNLNPEVAGDQVPPDATVEDYYDHVDGEIQRWGGLGPEPDATGPVAPPEPEGPTPSSPGDQGASPEAVSRVNNDKAAGVEVYRFDTRSNSMTPVPNTVDRPDTFAQPHEIILRRKGDDWQIESTGEATTPFQHGLAVKYAKAKFGIEPGPVKPPQPPPDAVEAAPSVPVPEDLPVPPVIEPQGPAPVAALDTLNPPVRTDVPAERRVVASGASGKPYEFTYRVVPLDELVTNHPDVQPRQRQRAASQVQIGKIASELDAGSYLRGGDTLERGSATIGPDIVVESGSGRIGAIRLARERHPELYAKFLEDQRTQAAKHGLTPEDFAAAGRDGVVVRERLTPVENRKAFAREANRRVQMGLSPLEQALDDATALPANAVADIQIGEKQRIEDALVSGRNAKVVQEFIDSLPDGDLNTLVNADGTSLTPAGVQRLKNALLARAFNDESGQRLLQTLIEGGTSNAKIVEGAIFNSAAKLAKMRELVKAGARDPQYDITGSVAKVINVLRRLREEGTPLDVYLRQLPLIGDRELTKFEEQLLEQFATSKSVNRLTDHMKAYADEVIDGPRAGQGGLPGVKTAPPSAADIWRTVGEPAPAQGALGGTLPLRAQPGGATRTARTPFQRRAAARPERALPEEVNPLGPDPLEDVEAATYGTPSGLPPPGTDTTADVNPPAEPRGKPEWVSRNTQPGKELVRRHEMVKWIADKLQIPIRYRHMGVTRDVLGFFKIRPKVVRTQTHGDIPTIYHEIGHWLKREQAGAAFVNKELWPFYNELAPLSYTHANPQRELEEGFAEFMRHYVESPSDLAKQAPRFTQYFKQHLDSELLDVFDQASRDWLRFRTQGPIARVLSAISFNKDVPVRSAHDVLDRVYFNTVDNLHGINVAVREMLKQAGYDAKKWALEFANDPMKYAELARGNMGRALTMLKSHTFSLADPFTEKGTGLFPILETLRDKGDRDWLDKFRVYALSRRVVERTGKGFKTGINVEDAHYAIQHLETPARKAAFDAVQEYQKHLLEYLVEGGVLSQASYRKILATSEDFVPLYRVLDWQGTSWGGSGGGFVDTFDPVKYFKGSSRPIIDPIESIVRNTVAYTSLAQRNMVGKTMLRLAETLPGGGEFMERVPWGKKPVFADRRHQVAIFDDLVKSGTLTQDQAEALLDALPDELLVGFMQTKDIPKDEPFVRVMADGKAHLVRVKDKFLYDSLKQLDTDAVQHWHRWIAGPASLLRAGATLDPDFMIRNVIKDNMMAVIQTAGGFKLGVSFKRGAVASALKDKDFYDFLATGGGQSHLVSADRDDLAKMLLHFDEYTSKAQKLKNVIRTPLDWLQSASMLGENATRVGETMAVKGRLKNTLMSPLEQSMRVGSSGRGVTTDFGRHGAKTTALRMGSAFWNARLQGLDRLAREAIAHPAKFMAKTALTVTMPSTLLWLANHDDPRYQELPQWQRDMFWIVIADKHVSSAEWAKMTPQEQERRTATLWRIPKPHELGMLFGSSVERALDTLYQQDPQAMTKWAGSFLSNISPIGFEMVPTAVKPGLEAYFNYSTFRNRPIVPPGLGKVEPREQKTPYSSGLASFLGNQFNLSPALIDSVVRGHTGGLGGAILAGGDRAADLARVVAGTGKTRPEPQWADVPGAKSIIARSPTSQAESLDRTWKQYHEGEQVTQTLNLHKKKNPEAAAAYYEAHKNELRQFQMVKPVAEQLQSLAKQLQALRDEPGDRSSRELARQMRVLQYQQLSLARDLQKRLEDLPPLP